MVEQFVGSWKMVSSENFDDFLKAMGKIRCFCIIVFLICPNEYNILGFNVFPYSLHKCYCIPSKMMCANSHAGVGFAIRQIASRTKPSLIVTVDQGIICLKMLSSFKTTEVKFKLDQAFDETTADGRNTTVS